MNDVLSLLADGLGLTILATGAAALLACLVGVVDLTCRRWLSPGVRHGLWLLVVLRLMIPFAPASPASLQNLFVGVQAPIFADQHASGVCLTPAPDTFVPDAGDPMAPWPDAPAGAGIRAPATPASSDVWSSIFDNLVGALLAIWLLGLLASLTWALVGSRRLIRRVSKSPASRDERLVRLMDECRSAMSVRREVPIVILSDLANPALMGLFKPRLLLPAPGLQALSDGQVKMLMLHELAHLKRWDIAVNWLLVLVRAVHWWNPVFWLSSARLRSCREQACDAQVIKHLGSEQRGDYGDLLVSLLEKSADSRSWRVLLPSALMGLLPPSLRNRAFRRRLRALQSARPAGGPLRRSLAAVLVVTLLGVGFTDAVEPAPDIVDDLPLLSLSSNVIASADGTPPAEDAVFEERTYDVSGLLDRLASREQARERLRALLRNALTCVEVMGGKKPRFTLNGTELRVEQTADQHEALAHVLKAWDESGFVWLTAEFWMIRTKRDLASSAGVEWKNLEAFAEGTDDLPIQRLTHSSASVPNGPVVRASLNVEEYLPVLVQSLNEKQASSFTQAAQADSGSIREFSPKMTLLNGQQALVFSKVIRPFVVGLRQTPAGKYQPIIRIVDDGVKLRLRTTLGSDAKTVQCDIVLELSRILDVKKASTPLKTGDKTSRGVTIQIPRVERRRIEVSKSHSLSDSLLIACLPTDDDRGFLYILLTVQNLGDEPSTLLGVPED